MTTEQAKDTEKNPLDALQCRGKSDVGLRREENQDSFGIIDAPNFRVYMVADGMGGVKGGLIASSTAVQVVSELLKTSPSMNGAVITEALTKANTAIFERGSTDPGLTGMGTTAVMLAFFETRLLVANIGDSRAYRLRDGVLEQLTEDHTLVNELLRAGSITEEQAGNHPVSHMLTRSLGPTPAIEIDCFESPDTPARGDVYLLCSDGLYNMVHPEEFAEIIQSLSIDEVPAELISLANMRGGTDNITVILIKVGDEYPLPTIDPSAASAPKETAVPAENMAADNHGDVGVNIDLKNLRAAVEAEAAETKAAQKTEQAAAQSESKGASEKTEAEATDQLSDVTGEKQDERAEKETAAVPMYRRYPWLAPGIVVLAAALTVAYVVGRNNAPQQTAAITISQPSAVTMPVIAAPPSTVEAAANSSASSAAATTTTSAAPVVAETTQPITTAPVTAPPPVALAKVEPPPAIVEPNPPSASTAADDYKKNLARAAELRSRLDSIQNKLAAFDQPISGKLAETLGQSLSQIAELEKKQDALDATVQQSSTQLSKWLGFKRRLEDQNPTELAAEVSDLSPQAKESQDAFQKATWAYLQEYEKSQQSAASPDEQKKVQTLAQGRTAAMEDLAKTIRAVVDEQIAKTNQAVTDGTLERDSVSSQVNNLREEVLYARILIGNDPAAREQEKKRLSNELKQGQDELKELQGSIAAAASPAVSEPKPVN